MKREDESGRDGGGATGGHQDHRRPWVSTAKQTSQPQHTQETREGEGEGESGDKGADKDVVVSWVENVEGCVG